MYYSRSEQGGRAGAAVVKYLVLIQGVNFSDSYNETECDLTPQRQVYYYIIIII